MPTLNWIGKEAVIKHHHEVPFHLLKDVPDLSCGDPGNGNLIVQGDNLVALKALLPHYAGHPAIKFWARNLSRRTTSFRLQTSTDWFYPDFIAMLHDGRILVVEYKGKHLSKTDDSIEKNDIGTLWESRSDGKCLFIMPNGPELEAVGKKIQIS